MLNLVMTLIYCEPARVRVRVNPNPNSNVDLLLGIAFLLFDFFLLNTRSEWKFNTIVYKKWGQMGIRSFKVTRKFS